MKKYVSAITLVIVIIMSSSCGCIENGNNNDNEEKNNPPIIEITYPTSSSGFDFFYNDTFIIKWKASDIDKNELKIDLFYSLDNLTWIIISQNESNDGEYIWSIGSDKLMTDRFFSIFFLKITASDGKEEAIDVVESIVGWSFPDDQNYTVYIEIISPNGGENWSGIQKIIWKMDSIATSPIIIWLNDLRLYDKRFNIDEIMVKNYTKIGNYYRYNYQWNTTKFKNGDEYKLIVHYNGSEDYSDGNFTIYNKDESINNNSSNNNSYNNSSINETKEAKLIALYLSGEIVAPDELYLQVLEELKKIRYSFNANESIKNISFVPPWTPSYLIKFNESTAKEIKYNEYHEWDELNKEYGVTRIDKQLLNSYNLIVLYFNYSYHPIPLRELYEELSGVINVSINGGGSSSYNIYPRKVSENMTYLFFIGWGDCPSGCIYRKYWYYKIENNQSKLIGIWNTEENPKEPDWWSEAEKNIDEYELVLKS